MKFGSFDAKAEKMAMDRLRELVDLFSNFTGRRLRFQHVQISPDSAVNPIDGGKIDTSHEILVRGWTSLYLDRPKGFSGAILLSRAYCSSREKDFIRCVGRMVAIHKAINVLRNCANIQLSDWDFEDNENVLVGE